MSNATTIRRFLTNWGATSPRLQLLPLLALGIAAFLGVAWATQPQGIGVKSDSVAYVEAARNLASGGGLGRVTPDGTFKPLAHFPPLYSSVLSVFERSGVDSFIAARWIAAFVAGVNTFLAGLLVLEVSGSALFAFLAAAALLASPGFLLIHLSAMTDPLGLAFELVGVLSVGRWLGTDRSGWLVLAGIAAALAALTRYAGVAVALLLGVAVLLRYRTFRSGLIPAAALTAVPLIPLGAWELFVAAQAGTPTNRTLAFHPATPAKVQELLGTLLSWIRPSEVWNTKALALVFVGLVVLMGPAVYRRWRGERAFRRSGSRRASMRRVVLVFGGIYALVVVLALTFFDATIPLDDRILAPIYVLALVGAADLAYGLWTRVPGRSLAAWVGFAAVAVLLSVVWQWKIVAARQVAGSSRLYGLGYANRAYQSMDIIKEIKRLPPGVTVFSDNPETLYYFTRRTSFLFPISYDSVRRAPRADYAEQLSFVSEHIHTGRVAFVFFRSSSDEESLIAADFPQMQIVCRCNDGLVYLETGDA